MQHARRGRRIPASGRIFSSPLFGRDHIASTETPQQKILRAIELAIDRCGSASELARRLSVSPATVCQWRACKKNPDAVHLVRIQEMAARQSLLS